MRHPSFALTPLGFFLFLIPTLSGRMVTLTDNTFEEELSKSKKILVYFHADWSNDSEFILNTQFVKMPEYIEDRDMVYAMVTQRQYLTCNKYNIKSPYPRIVFINDGKSYLYEGGLQSKLIADWVMRKMYNQLIELKEGSELSSAVMEHERIVILVGREDYISDLKSLNLPDAFTDLHFYAITNMTLINSLNIEEKEKSSEPKVVIFKTYDEHISLHKVDFTNKREKENIESFIRSYSYPLLNHYSSANYLHAINSKYNFSVVILPAETESNRNAIEELLNAITEEAKKLRDQMYFMYTNLSEQSQSTLAMDFEISEKDLPVILINSYSNTEHLIKRFKAEISMRNVKKEVEEFYQKYVYGVLRRYLKSEKLPESDKLLVNNVYRLVRKNFEEIVINKNKDKYALIYFVRRNCALCIEYQQAFEHIATALSNDKQIIFGMIDGFANEFDELDIKEYPLVVLFRPGKNKYKNYVMMETPKITIANIKEFLKVHMKTIVDIFNQKDDL